MGDKGREETYAYLTLDELITAVAVHSADAAREHLSVLLPAQDGDIVLRRRGYYNRYLAKRLANPLTDAKQMVLFSHIDTADSEKLGQALAAIRGTCGKHSLARVYAALPRRMKPMIEVERKREVGGDAEKIKARLAVLGYREAASSTEADTYYSRPDVDFLETVECLRVRRRPASPRSPTSRPPPLPPAAPTG
ncbi:CYTH domain-containing protein [Nocardiopsis composta]